MTSSWKTIRVFISSTFRDMHAERDQLNRFVFPELRSRCQQRGVEFVGIDLRWGLTAEEARGDGALQTCLEEIERCRPFFVCLLGERFGWVPPPHNIKRDFYEQIRNSPQLVSAKAERLDEWYRLDESSEPPVYQLRRDRELPPDLAEWFVRFWELQKLPLAGHSITAREIMRGVFEKNYPATRAFFYLRQPGITDSPEFPKSFVPVFTEVEPRNQSKVRSVRNQIEERADQFTVRTYEGHYAGLRIDPAILPPQLSAQERKILKAGLIQTEDIPHLSEEVRQIVNRQSTVALTGMDELGQMILDDLWSAIEAELGDQKLLPQQNENEHLRERLWHRRFLEERTRLIDPKHYVRSFVGREKILTPMLAYAREGINQPLVITGLPGSGKSALLAEFALRCEEKFRDTLVLSHFIGASPGSAELSRTLYSLCTELQRHSNLNLEVPDDPHRLQSKLKVFLEQAAARRPVILILDALDQLNSSTRGADLDWLPAQLPRGVHIIVSTSPGESLDALRNRSENALILELGELTDDDRRVIVDQQLARRRKKLTAEQLTKLLDPQHRPDIGLPLYLQVAVEELCLFGSHEDLEQRIDRLPGTVEELFAQVLARLEADHGWELVQSVCGWIAVSRAGLLESEITDLLRRMNEQVAPRHWSQLYRSLEFYLKPAAEKEDLALIDFAHVQLRNAVYTRYFEMASPQGEPTEACRARHHDLISYYHTQLNPVGKQPWSGDSPRGLAELPYHQLSGHFIEELEATLTDLQFLQAKCRAGRVYDLTGDYAACLNQLAGNRQRVQDEQSLREHYSRELIAYAKAHARENTSQIPLPEPPDTRQTLESMRNAEAGRVEQSPDEIANTPAARIGEFARFISSHAHVLKDFPDEIIPLAFNSVARGIVAERAGSLIDSLSRSWLCRVSRPPTHSNSPLCVRMLTGHKGFVHSVALTADGMKAISSSADKTLRVWDISSGECLKSIEGHKGPIFSLAITPDAKTAISSALQYGQDKPIRVWDLMSGEFLRTLAQYKGWAQALAITPDGAKAISAGEDQIVHIWDVKQRKCLKSLKGHTEAVRAVDITPDGRKAISGGNDKTVRVWDLTTGKCLRTISNTGDVAALAITPDGKKAVHPYFVWDLESGECLRKLTGHTGRPLSLALTPDGRTAVMGCQSQNVISVWDVDRGERLRILSGHSGWVYGVAITPDGKTAVSASQDKTLRVWNLASGVKQETLEGHTRRINALALSPDGEWAASAGDDGKLNVWEFDSGESLCTSTGREHSVAGLIFSEDGQQIVSRYQRQKIGVWNFDSLECTTRHSESEEWLLPGTVTANARTAILARTPETLAVLDIQTGKSLCTLPGHTGGVFAVALIADGTRAAVASLDKALRIWDLQSGDCLKTLTGLPFRPEKTAVSPDAETVLFQTSGKSLYVWNVSDRLWDQMTRESVQTIEGYAGGEFALIPGREGNLLIAGGEGDTLCAWDTASGNCVQTFSGSPGAGRLRLIKITPDGKRMVSSSHDATLRLWNLETGTLDSVYPLDSQCTALSEFQGNRIVAGTEKGQLHFLKLCLASE